jgi:hypothetical protein
MDKKTRRQWVHVFNSAIERGEDEGTAMAMANGVSNKETYVGWEAQQRQISQEAANYNPVGGDNEKACANCNWFVSPDGCILVGGTISPTGISNYWNEQVVHYGEPIPVHIVKEDDEDAQLDIATKDGSLVTTDSDKAVAPPVHERVIEHVIKFARGMIGKKEDLSSFTLYKDSNGRLRFFSLPTNMYQDRQGQILRSVAHKEYVGWADETKIYPELWMWHVPGARIGVCDWLEFTPNGMLCASGTIDEGFEELAQNLATKDVAMSHGMFRLKDGNEITKYRSFEISVLPRSRAANFGTDFLVSEKDFMFAEDKRKFFLESGVSEQQVKEWEEREEQFGSKMKELGIAWKEGEQTTEQAAQSEIAQLTQAVQGLTEKVTNLETGLSQRVEAVEKSFDDKLAESITAQIAKLPQGFKPTESDKNVVTETESGIQNKEHANTVDWFYESVVGKAGK